MLGRVQLARRARVTPHTRTPREVHLPRNRAAARVAMMRPPALPPHGYTPLFLYSLC